MNFLLELKTAKKTNGQSLVLFYRVIFNWLLHYNHYTATTVLRLRLALHLLLALLYFFMGLRICARTGRACESLPALAPIDCESVPAPAELASLCLRGLESMACESAPAPAEPASLCPRWL